MTLEPTKALLQARLGLRFDGHSEARLQRALDRRMAVAGVTGASAYLARLDADESELLALAGLLTIKETYFYREPEHLRLLTEHLAPRRLDRGNPGTPVRILSAGCATGEEPYSIAMALRERWGESSARLFRIDACDLDPQAIAVARVGRYRPYSFRALPPALVARWFTPGPHELRQIAAPIRDGVTFRHLNLLADPYPDELHGQDVIFYRNLSIYFDAPTRESVLRRLGALLRPGGYLIVGLAETLANGFGLLTLREREGVWYFVNRSEGVAPPRVPAESSGCALPDPAVPRLSAVSPLPPVVAGPPRHDTPCLARAAVYRQALALAQAERFAAALAVLTPVCGEADAPPQYRSLQAHLLLAQGDVQGAASAARRVLAADAWAVDALVLLGRLARVQGALGEAVDYLRRAIYQRPDHWSAHFELGECRRAAGNPAAARREYLITLRLLEQARDGAAEGAGPLPPTLPVADLRHLCRARLARLADVV